MSQSLGNLRVLNTRPKGQASKLSQDIRKAGGVVIEFPCLEIKATSSRWINLLPDLATIDQAIFTSINAVDYCFMQLNQLEITWPSSIKVIAIGKGSAAALQRFNVTVSDIPNIPDSEHLLALNTFQQQKKQNVLLFKGKGGRPLITEHLKKRGFNLTILDVYQRIMPKKNHPLMKSIWRDDLVDIILITSEQSLYNLFKLFDKEAYDWLRHKKWLIISERVAQIASTMKIEHIKITPPERMMTSLFDYVNKD